MTDQLLKALAFDGQVRVFVVKATETVAEGQARHDSWHTATAAFGRILVGTLLLSANLKGEDRLKIDVIGSGPIGRISCDGDTHGNVRGRLDQPHVALPLNEQGKLDVKGAIGLPGELSVQKTIEGGQPFVGQVALVSGELGEDLTYYMAVSEQTPSAIGLSVLVDTDESVKAAGGFMIQMMPDAQEETIVALENQLQRIGRFSDLIDQGLSNEELLMQLVGEGNYQILSETPVQYYCPCSKERFASQLELLELDDLQAMIDEDGGAEVVCQYCNAHYNYSVGDLEDIIVKKNNE